MDQTKRIDSRWQIVFFGLLFLFFLQLITEFIEAMYVFGLLGTSIPPEIVAVLLFFSPLIWLALPSRWAGGTLRGGRWLLVLIVLAARVLVPALDTRGRMLVAGSGVSAFLLLLPALLWVESRREAVSDQGSAWGWGLGLALALALPLRAFQSGIDLSTAGDATYVGWGLALVAAVLAGFVLRAPREIFATGEGARQAGAPRQATGGIAWLGLGLVAVWVLLYYAFASPNVIARWTESSYTLVAGLVGLALAGAVWFAGGGRRLGRGWLVLWNLAFVAALALTLWLEQIPFPGDPAAYPLDAPPGAPDALLAVTLLLWPVILLDFRLYVTALIARRPTLRALGGAFSLAGLYFVVMVFAHVFTTVYEYIPLVGPVFRDRFWLVHLVASLVVALPATFISSKPAQDSRRASRETEASGVWAVAIALLSLLAVGGVYLTRARPVATDPAQHSLRVLTYNIQQGYSEAGLRNYDGQLALMRTVGADLIGLQESDTNRIAGGNADLVRYLADELDMYAYYGPTPVVGTFGIALLSRFPLENPRTFYMYSEAEQTATILAQVTVGGQRWNVFVTHLGNGGPLVQQENLLARVAGLQNVILMGDFNFRPGTPQYQLTVELLEDAWLLRWPAGIDDQGLDPARRVDHVFVSPGIEVREARFLTDPQSDHPAEWVEILW